MSSSTPARNGMSSSLKYTLIINIGKYIAWLSQFLKIIAVEAYPKAHPISEGKLISSQIRVPSRFVLEFDWRSPVG